MNINKFGQITNKKEDLLLTKEQEEYIKSLLNSNRATSLSLRYGRAIWNNLKLPENILGISFQSIEDAFTCLDTLEYASQHDPYFDGYDYNLMRTLQYWIGDENSINIGNIGTFY